MNYPRLWIWLFDWSGFDRHVEAFEAGVIVLLLASFSHLIVSTSRWSSAVCVWLGSLSWVVFLVTERGNTDMVAFLLTYAASTISFAGVAVMLLTLAALLKLYPGAAFLVSPLAGRRPRLWYNAGLGTVFLYLLLTRQDLLRIQQNTPHDGSISYGVSSLIVQFLPAVSSRTGAALTILVALAGGIVCWWGVQVRNHMNTDAGQMAGITVRSSILTASSRELFLVFGTIFLATFLLTPNFLYRLIFLVPTLPFWCELGAVPRWRLHAGAALALTLLSLDSPLLHHTGVLEPWFMQSESCARCALYPVYSFFLGWAAVAKPRQSRGLRSRNVEGLG